MSAASRDIDVVARFGGEEFLVLLPGSDTVDAESFSERVRHALASADPRGLPSVRVSAGVHATTAPGGIDLLVRRVDMALYEAKRTGRDRTVVFRSEAVSPSA